MKIPGLRLTLALLLAGAAMPSVASINVLVDEVTSIYDADTFRVNIKGWPDIVGHRVPVRVKGVDAPELRARCPAAKLAARKAKQFTVARLRGAKVIELRDIERGKYFRILAEVWIDGDNLAELLVHEGLARRYSGGARAGWCEGST